MVFGLFNIKEFTLIPAVGQPIRADSRRQPIRITGYGRLVGQWVFYGDEIVVSYGNGEEYRFNGSVKLVI